jgi:hypothetical protein
MHSIVTYVVRRTMTWFGPWVPVPSYTTAIGF